MKINYRLVLPPVIFILFCAVSILLLQLTGDKPLSPSEIHEQSQELASYARESTTLVNEYQKGHLTSIYLTEQLQQIQKQVLSLSNTLSSAQLSTKDEETVAALIDISEEYSATVRSVTRAPEDKKSTEKGLNTFEKEISQIDTLTKHYE
jgi:hypothetical protein